MIDIHIYTHTCIIMSSKTVAFGKYSWCINILPFHQKGDVLGRCPRRVFLLSLEYKQSLLFCEFHHESQTKYQWKKVDVRMLQETLEVMLICRRSPMSEAYFLSASLIELLQCIGVTSRVSLGTLTVFVFHWIFFWFTWQTLPKRRDCL